MTVYIKNKVVSIGGSSDVLNEQKKPVYRVKGKVMSPTRKKVITDMQGNRLFTVRNKWFNFFVHKVYVYDGNGKKIARVKDKFFNVHKQFFIDGYKDEIHTEGAFFSRSTGIFRNGAEIGRITRQITFITDAFALDADEEDIPFLIALVIAIDNIQDKIRRETK